jgi:hypothetical protein
MGMSYSDVMPPDVDGWGVGESWDAKNSHYSGIDFTFHIVMTID